MKILLLNTSARTGGAAVAANRLRKALQKKGIDVSMLVRDKEIADASISSVSTTGWKRKMNLFRFYWERLIIFLCNHLDKKELFRVSIANTGTDISNHPLVRQADIIHLHWINQGFLSLSDLQKLFQLDKPIVWTMHDMWPCTGICHHARECSAYHERCWACFYLHSTQHTDLSTRVFLQKNKVYHSAPITFVGCSRWLTERAAQSALLKDKQVINIPNPLDLSLFTPKDISVSRKLLHLPEDKHLILFGALNVTDSRKGVDYLIQALRLLSRNDMELVVFGQVKREIKDLVPVPIHSLGYLSDDNQIVALYNAVDLFVTSSLDENLPNTIMEAMACGTPCVGFQTGGIPEMIDHLKNGYVARYQDAEDLAQGITWVLDHPHPQQLAEACVEKVKTHYSEEVIAGKYIALYQKLMDKEEK